ncbi:MAG: class A beta-lactamase [Nocardia sp.]|nr:class A beta-lactamase [Nocardia sp.]
MSARHIRALTITIIAALLPLGACTTNPAAPDSGAAAVDPADIDQFHALEGRLNGRIGVYALDTGSGRSVGYRADERFAYASTFKALAAGVWLSIHPASDLDRRRTVTRADLVANSPVTSAHVDQDMTMREILSAAINVSDNTAGNLIFSEIGGPAGLQQHLRRIGDATTHADRTETALNTAIPGDDRDTTTPRTFATDLRHFTLDPTVPAATRTTLTDMLKATTTGGALVRAALPPNWQAGDKTGAGDYGTRNDIAVLWPPNRAPILIAVMSVRDRPDAPYDNPAVARAASLALTALDRTSR